MALKSAPFYWMVCDGDGCDERSPAEDNPDYVAVAEVSQASEQAMSDGWEFFPSVEGTGGRWLCPGCWPPVADEEQS